MMMSSPPAADGAMAMVVAHPDDEALWLSACLAATDRIVFCFGDPFGRPVMAAARRRAVAALPLEHVTDLHLPESGAGFLADWRRPRLTGFGVEIIEAAARRRYEANYRALVAALRPVLAGCRAVCTHNPWGEYGHAEHVQVYRAAAALQAELGFTLWFSNYVGPRSWPLAVQLCRQPVWTERREVKPDRAAAGDLRRAYRRHGAWTWTAFHRWPAAEILYAQPPAGDAGTRHALAGERLLDVRGLRWWPPPWRRAHRRLG